MYIYNYIIDIEYYMYIYNYIIDIEYYMKTPVDLNRDML